MAYVSAHNVQGADEMTGQTAETCTYMYIGATGFSDTSALWEYSITSLSLSPSSGVLVKKVG